MAKQNHAALRRNYARESSGINNEFLIKNLT